MVIKIKVICNSNNKKQIHNINLTYQTDNVTDIYNELIILNWSVSRR
jgi:hypothetical protein